MIKLVIVLFNSSNSSGGIWSVIDEKNTCIAFLLIIKFKQNTKILLVEIW